ncbi:MAG: type II toxin-antitoxin system HicA family toxin [bacterium]|nr:type II toxin-antitoxin system HicA family toxin [bacterium]
MKRREFVKHLVRERCLFVREGGRHSIFFNPETKRSSTVPRHNDIDALLARKICRDLGVREPKSRGK